MTSPDPIFVLGVPRSGTTLLRILLDSHPAIACGPETPWLGGHQPRSVMDLCRALTDEPWGYCRSFGMPPETVTAAARTFVDTLLRAHAEARGKRRWAEKTPDNLLHVDFLASLFPGARFVSIVRDGLDAAASTAHVAEHRRGISAWHEENLPWGPDAFTGNSVFTALLRWRHWNRLLARSLEGRQHLSLRYEDLVARPEPTVRDLCAFLGEAFDPAMLDYARREHEYPSWEWGSADARTLGRITASRVGRAAQDLTPDELAILEPIAHTGRLPTTPPEPGASLASLTELESTRFRTFMRWLNGFAGPLGLRTFETWSKVWEYPWLWFHALSRRRWEGAGLVDLGSELSPMPWVLATLGARVTLIETDAQFVPLWTRLRDALRVDVSWKIVDSEKLPIETGSADAVTSLSVIEHQPDKAAAVAEAARVLRPGGVFALSYDICEPELGMTFPEWNGRALTLAEFERDVWSCPAFGRSSPPVWNREDVAPFHAWHRTTAPHHNYVVGAAVLTKA